MGNPSTPSSNNVPWAPLNIPWTPLLPARDWDPRKVSIEILITLVLVTVGMGPLEQSMKDTINDQNIQNKVDADMIQLSNLISEIEAASKAGGADVQGLQAQLQATLKNLFGAGAHIETTADGQKYIVPDDNSDLGKFIEMLKQKNIKDPNYDYHKDPVFDLLNQVGTYLFGNSVTGEYQDPTNKNWISYSAHIDPKTGKPENMWQVIMNGSSSDFQGMINAMAGNHWLSENPGTKDGGGTNVPIGTDYLSTMYNQTSGAQSGLQGMGSQNTALIQTDSSSENSLDQTGQNILNAAKDLKLFLIQHAAGS